MPTPVKGSNATPTAPQAKGTPAVPTRDLRRGDKGDQVKRLQADLVKLGFMTQAAMNTGPGIFGPQTQASLRAFQRAHHLPVTGTYNDDDEKALAGALSARAKASTFAGGALRHGSKGAAVKELQSKLVKLGYMTQAAMNTGPGVFGPRTFASLKAFQRAHKLAATGVFDRDDRTAMDKALAAPARRAPKTPGASGRITTVAEANKYFLTQWGRTAYNAGGTPYGFNDCAPTSAVIVASSLGEIADPSPAGAARAIDRMRDLCHGHNTNYSSPTSPQMLVRGLRAAGTSPKWIAPTPASIDAVLAKGGRVVVNGDPWTAWGKSLAAHGKYLNRRDPGNHSCAILGKTAGGRYLLADPLAKSGVLEITAAQLEKFWHAGSNAALAVYK